MLLFLEMVAQENRSGTSPNECFRIKKVPTIENIRTAVKGSKRGFTPKASEKNGAETPQEKNGLSRGKGKLLRKEFSWACQKNSLVLEERARDFEFHRQDRTENLNDLEGGKTHLMGG